MSLRVLLPLLLLLNLALWSCSTEVESGKPAPRSVTREDVGYFCGMIVEDHTGPKSQIILAGQDRAVWFTSVRDGIAYGLLPEETAKVQAFYVTAMDRADWDHPEQVAAAWIDARSARYVIESRRKGGMGAPEAIPFAEEATAAAFVSEYGGRVVGYAEVPESYILGHGQQRPK